MTEPRDPEARVRLLEDLEASKRLKYRYFRCIDKGLWDEIGDCFTEEAVADIAQYGVIEGRATIAKFFKEGVGPAYSMCVHQGHNPEIDVASDTTATAYGN